MESELARILGSSVNLEVSSAIEHNEEEINKLQRILSDKNNQVVLLHQKINAQLLTNIEENQKLKKSNQLYKRTFSQLKNQINSLKKFVKIYAFECLESVMKDFDELGLIIKQKSQRTPVEDISIQTDQFKNEQNDLELLEKIQYLERNAERMKTQKQQLQKELNKYKFALYGGDEYNSVNSQAQISLEEKRKIILKHIQYKFKGIQQEKYCGEIIGKQKHGQGCCEYTNNFKYEGMFMNGKRSGLGTMKHNDQVIYHGYWENDCFHGKGMLCFLEDQSIQKYSGNFNSGIREGYGTLQYLNGQKIRAKWRGDEMLGNAVIEDENGMYYGCAIPESRVKTDPTYILSI